jgi:predicted transcriptional regulator
MKIIRADEIPYAQIPNDLIRDPSLSGNSVRLWAYLASHNSGYNLTYEQIERQTGMKQFAIQESAKKLVESGWLRTERNKDAATGRWLPLSWILLNKSTSGNSITGDSTMEQTVHKNTNLTDIDIKKTNNKNLEQDFEKFWAVYPHKTGKLAAQRAFAKALTVTDFDTLLAGAVSFANDPNLPSEKKYIKHPATWLNAGCWDDEPLPVDPKAQVERSVEASKRSVEASKAATRDLLAEQAEWAVRVAENPPEYCVHGRVKVICRESH